MSLIEAQACGCPVIGTDVIGVNEVVLLEHGVCFTRTRLIPPALQH
jgi:glycosyltransferase involved in cell wall biosynthesis